jgi:phosphatidylglycerol:prolipoprotein diacylglycerol transferase
MHPVLFKIPVLGGIAIHSYGLMMALGVLAAVLWVRSQASRQGLPAKRMVDLAFLLVLAAVVGSRLVFILVEWRYYLADPMAVFRVWEGGLVFYGGLIACTALAWIYLKKHALPFWKVADLFMPGVALGHAIGRVGCFLAGCCHGLQCDPAAWYAVVFPGGVGSIAPPGVALYPTQLIEAAAEFLLFLFLAWKSRKKAFDGQILLLYLIVYSLLRVLIEFLRGDMERGFVLSHHLSTSQFISLVLLVGAVFVLIFRKGRSS